MVKCELKRMISLLQEEKLRIFFSIICLFISCTVTIGVPYAIGGALDMIVTNKFPEKHLQIYCIALLVIFLIGSLADLGRIYLINSASKLGSYHYYVYYN